MSPENTLLLFAIGGGIIGLLIVIVSKLYEIADRLKEPPRR